MAVSTPFARSYFRTAWSEAQAAGTALVAKLDALNASAVAQVSAGRSIISSSGNGRRVDFQIGGGVGVSPNDIVELCSRLRDLYDASAAAGNASDEDHATYILDQLVAIRSVRSDYSRLRGGNYWQNPVKIV